MTPSQLRSLVEKSNNEAVNLRLSQYFFDAGLWDRLPEDARNALVVCDTAWMDDGPESRLLRILSSLQRATEQILYNYLWLPINGWAEHLSDDSDFLSRLLSEHQKRHPGLAEYIKLLRGRLAKRYLQDVNTNSEDVKFLTTDLSQHLWELRDRRNKAEHEPDPGVALSDIKRIYRASLGKGRRGILPSLVCMLSNVHT